MIKSFMLLFGFGIVGSLLISQATAGEVVTDLGSRRELMVDEFLIAKMTNLKLTLHPPVPKEVVMVRDAPWEGSGSDFETAFRDSEIIRMYYMGMELTSVDGLKFRDNPEHRERRTAVVCYAESRDGIHWTKPDHWKKPTRLRRNTIRIDGFVSLHAERTPGEWVSKPLRFAGGRLSLNFSTSAAGSIRVELQDEAGRPLPGHSLAECDELFGDTLDRSVTWTDRSDVSELSLAHDELWEGAGSGYHRIFKDGNLYRMHYEGTVLASFHGHTDRSFEFLG